MTPAAALLILFLLALATLAAATVLVAVRGGRGPGDPPASRPRVDPAGFFVLSEPRGLLPSSPARTRVAGRASAGRLCIANRRTGRRT